MFFHLLCLADSWAKPGKPIKWNWSQNGIWWNDVECPRLFIISLWANVIFSCCCYHQPFLGVHLVKRSEMVLDTIAAVEWKNGGGLCRVGSGRVNDVLYPTWPKPHSFFAAPRTASISCQQKLWCKLRVITTGIFSESVVVPLITKEESILRQN